MFILTSVLILALIQTLVIMRIKKSDSANVSISIGSNYSNHRLELTYKSWVKLWILSSLIAAISPFVIHMDSGATGMGFAWVFAYATAAAVSVVAAIFSGYKGGRVPGFNI